MHVTFKHIIKQHIVQQLVPKLLKIFPRFKFKYFLSMTEFSVLNYSDYNSPIHHW